MATLFNKFTQKNEEISDDDASKLISEGAYEPLDGEKHYIEDEDGTEREIDPARARLELEYNPNKKYLSQEAYNKKKQMEEYGTLPQQSLAFGESTVQGAIPFGKTILAKGYEQIGVDPQGIALREEANPVTNIVGNIAGIGATLGLAPEAKIVAEGGAKIAEEVVKRGLIGSALSGAKKVAQVATAPQRKIITLVDDAGRVTQKLAERLGGGGVGSKAIQSAVNLGTQGLLSGSIQGAQDGVADMVINDHEFTGENVVNDVFKRAGISGISNGVLGAGVGFTGRLGYEAMKKTGGFGIKSTLDFMKKIGGKFKSDPPEVPPQELNLEAIPRTSNLLKKDKSAIFEREDDGGNIFTNYAGKRKYQFDENAVQDKILDLNDKKAVFDNVREVYQMPESALMEEVADPNMLLKNTAHEVKKTLYFFLPELSVAKKMAYRNGTPAQRELIEVMANRDLAENLLQRLDSLNPSQKGLLTRIKKDVKNKMFKLSLENSTKKEFNMFSADFEELMRSKYAGFKIGDKINIARPSMLQGSISEPNAISSIEKQLENNNKIPEHIKAFLKWANVSKPLLRKVPIKRLIDAGEYIENKSTIAKTGVKSYIGKMDTLADNVVIDKNIAIRKMEDSINEAQNSLSDIGNDFIDMNQLASEAEDILIRPYVYSLDKVNGIPDASPLNMKIVQNMEPFINELKDMGVRQGRGELEVTIPLLRQKRIEIDNQINNFFKNPLTGKIPDEMDKFKTDLRWFIEEKVMEKLEGVPGGDKILKKYEAGKDMYSILSDVEKLVGESKMRDASNNRFGLTYAVVNNSFANQGKELATGLADSVKDVLPYVATGAGYGGVAGSMIPFAGTVAGSVAGATGMLFYKKYGEFIIGKTLKGFHSNNIKTMEQIDNAIVKFFEKKLSRGIVLSSPVHSGVDLQKEYFKDKKELADFRMQADNMLETIKNKNPDMFALLPQYAEASALKAITAVEFLESKFPRPSRAEEGADWEPKNSDMMRYLRFKNAVMNPGIILDHLSQQYISAEELEVLNTVYPAMKKNISSKLVEKWNMKRLNSNQKKIMSDLAGVNNGQSMTPAGVAFYGQPGQQAEENPDTRKSNYEMAGQEQTINDRIGTK